MVREIVAGTLNEWTTDGSADPLVIDIRTEAEYCIGHVPGSVNIPLSRLTSEIDVLDGAERIVIICEVGELSRKAARLVESFEGIDQDVTVATLNGGYRGWTDFRGRRS